MIDLLVLADDFTGALDTGVQFSNKGIKTLVTTKLDMDPAYLEKDIRVLVLDTESRHIQFAQAYQRVRKVAEKAKLSGIKHIYKKTDSTLRGNIGSELTALLDAYGSNNLAFIPAFPQTGRTTVNGYQYVNGILLHETAFAKDPLEPMEESYIPDIIQKQSDVKTRVLCGEDLNRFVFPRERTILIFDVQKEKAFLQIGRFLKINNRFNVLAGCAGFASVLPMLLEIEEEAAFDRKKRNQSKILVICGSMNERSLAQARHAEKNGFSGITLKPWQKLNDNYYETTEGREFIHSMVSGMESGTPYIIKNVSGKEDAALCDEYAKTMKFDTKGISAHIAKNVAKLAKILIEKNKVENVVVFGGDTAVAIMREIECDGFYPRQEIMPGVVASEVISKNYQFQLITKAGGFGDEDVLLKIRQYIAQ